MTIGWAIVIVAVLFLLDKYSLLRKTLKVSGIVLGIGVCVGAVVLGVYYGWEAWKDHQFAKTHECYDTLTGKAHPVNGSERWCTDINEEVRLKFSLPKGVHLVGPIIPLASASQGIGIGDPIPPGAVIGSAPETLPADYFDHARPVVSRNEFLFRRPGEKEYSKAICYDENTGKVSHSPKGSEGCRAGSFLMEEVK